MPCPPAEAAHRHRAAACPDNWRAFRRRLGGVLALLAMLAMQPASAWNGTGHRLIAAIAWESLDPAVRRRVGDLLSAHPALPRWQAAARSSAPRDLFIEAATWPDTTRRGPQAAPADAAEAALGPRRRWHYANIPLDAPHAGPRGGALHLALPALERRLADRNRTAAERADDLVWLSHLVGDAHQPLHVVSRFADPQFRRHDAGGNRLAVRLPGQTRSTGNLHAVWDNLPGGGGLRGGRLDRRARELARLPLATDVGGSSAEWILESHALAQSGVYPPGEGAPLAKGTPLALDAAYLAWAKARADEQLVHAGRRLAATINRRLADDAPPR